MEKKEKYTPPVMEVIPMETESVIAGSGNVPDIPIRPLGTTTSRGRQSYSNSTSMSELEDMINDILTIEQ